MAGNHGAPGAYEEYCAKESGQYATNLNFVQFAPKGKHSKQKGKDWGCLIGYTYKGRGHLGYRHWKEQVG